MAFTYRRNRVLVGGSALIVSVLLAGCSTPTETDQSAPTTLSASTTPAVPLEVAEDDYTVLCEANNAAAAAKAGTVGEDLEAVTAQAVTIRALLPLQDVSAEVAAGAGTFAASTEETAAILAQFPADSLVSDVGLDSKFTESDALRDAVSDPDYQAFILWTMETCGLSSD